MIKTTDKIKRAVWLFLYGQMIFIYGAIIVLSIMKPRLNLIGWQMAAGTALGTGILIWGGVLLVPMCPGEIPAE